MEKILKFLQEQTTASDLPSESDYRFEEVFENAGGEIPHEFILNNTPILNQKQTMRCTIFSFVKVYNEEQFLDEKKYITPDDLLQEAIDNGFSEKTGWYIKGPLDIARKRGIIDGYTRVVGKDQIIQALLKNQLICTGSNKTDWIATHKTGTFVDKVSSTGHAWCIIGYNLDGYFWCANSYSEDFGFKGLFKLPFDKLGFIYSTYSVADNKTSIITNYKKMKDKESIKLAVEKGIGNGQDLDRNIPRREIFIMFGRFIKKLEENGIKLNNK